MSQPAPPTAPRLTDRAALIRNRARARDEALFLHKSVFEDLHDRLSMVKKSFTAPLIVGPQAALCAGMLGLSDRATCIDDDDRLEVTPQAHDLAIHAMSLHWASDPVGQIIQCHRALKPDGLFLACFFGGETLHELRSALAQAETEVTGGLSPRVAPMAEIREVGGLLQRAGLALPVADTDRLTVTYETPLHLMRELRHMGEGNALHHRLRQPSRRAVFARASEIYTQHHATADGRVKASFEIIHLSGWAPDASQPKPLRPGSATHRLASVLGQPGTGPTD